MILHELPPRSLRLQIDSGALAANWSALDRLSRPGRAGAAVKADGYGLGIGQVMPALTRAGAREFFVAHWSEVPAVLAHVPASAVSVLHGPVTAEQAAFARAMEVRPVINSLHQAKLWGEAGGGLCHLMVDTGINRLGLSLVDLADPSVEKLHVDVLMSHLASADEDNAQNAQQLALFREVVGTGRAARYSLANSAGIALGPDYRFDLSRPGLAIYGGVPRSELAQTIRQVVHLQAAVIQLRDLRPGDRVGYNATFTASRAMRAALVSVGYADGLLRSWSGKGGFRFEGSQLPLIGRVSMDIAAVDASAAPGLRPGDYVDVPYTLPEAARLSGLSQYELLTCLGERFYRTAN